jgi:hypothetical protein
MQESSRLHCPVLQSQDHLKDDNNPMKIIQKGTAKGEAFQTWPPKVKLITSMRSILYRLPLIRKSLFLYRVIDNNVLK